MLLFVCVMLLLSSHRCNVEARSKSSKMPIQPIKLYYFSPSPPCRSVMMTAKLIGLDLELIVTNIMKGEHMTPEFVKMNPQHTIPTMDDSGFILGESRAILTYLVSSYAKDDMLYPKNLRQRAIVDQRLNFDIGTLFPRYLAAYVPVIFTGAEPDMEMIKNLNQAIEILNIFLDGKPYVAGENMTVADISILVVFTNLKALEHDFSAYDNVNKWFERMKLAMEPYGYKDIDEAGAQILVSFAKKD